MDLRGIIVFIFCGVGVITAFTGKGYFCRDPDTGFLHPANSSWQSTTFCGNYTCKLRKKSTSQTSVPLRALNVSNVNISQPTLPRSVSDDILIKNEVPTPSEETPKETIIPLDSPDLAILKSLLPSGKIDLSKLNIHDRLKHHPSSDNEATDNSDRFLTETEIKSISELLHTVKKSDLEAIVEVYSLAQDIYNEMDKMTSENIVEETMRFANVLNDNTDSTTNQVSYWYEPSYRLNKVDAKDMDNQGSNIVTTTTPVRSTGNPSSQNSYFGGALTKTDYAKLPYYYPISNFQRQSSYIHPTYNSQPPAPQPTAMPPSNAYFQINNLPAPVIPPQYQQPVSKPYNYVNQAQGYGSVLKKPFTIETQQAKLLPYPFSYVQHYNMSGYPFNNYYDQQPWGRFDLENKRNQKSFYKAQLSQIHSNALPGTSDKIDATIKTDVNKKKGENESLLDTLLERARVMTKSKPAWQTDPIPKNILDEVKAHFEEKAMLLMPFSLRKKVKLERVGKVLKLDELSREKRSVVSEDKPKETEDGDMEAYIEKTTCLSDVHPGYFRMGNLTEPYPACCPQRISETNKLTD